MEQAGPLTVGVVLGILTAFIHVYFLLWQNYVYVAKCGRCMYTHMTRSRRHSIHRHSYVIDVALNGTALGLFVIEFALAVPTLVAFSRPV